MLITYIIKYYNVNCVMGEYEKYDMMVQNKISIHKYTNLLDDAPSILSQERKSSNTRK